MEKKESKYREDGNYIINWKEIEERKQENIRHKLRGKKEVYTEEQIKFLRDYWFFLKGEERVKYCEVLFPGLSYSSVVNIVESLKYEIKFNKPGGEYNKVDEDQNRRIVELYEKGVLIPEIAKIFDLSCSNVEYNIKCYRLNFGDGITKKHKRSTYTEEKEKIIDLYKNGMKIIDISRTMKLSTSTIHRRLRDFRYKTNEYENDNNNDNEDVDEMINLTEDQIKVILNLYYDENKSLLEISNIMDIPKSVIRKKIIDSSNGDVVSSKWNFNIPEQEIFKMYVVEKKTPKEIAKRYGCSVNVIYQKLKKHGWKNRTKKIPSGVLEEMIKEKPVSVISEELNVSNSSIYRKLHNEGLLPEKKKGREKNTDQDDRIIDLYKNGTKLVDISVIVGLSKATVGRRVHDFKKFGFLTPRKVFTSGIDDK